MLGLGLAPLSLRRGVLGLGLGSLALKLKIRRRCRVRVGAVGGGQG